MPWAHKGPTTRVCTASGDTCLGVAIKEGQSDFRPGPRLLLSDGCFAADGLPCEHAKGGASPSALEQPSCNRVSATACGGKGLCSCPRIGRKHCGGGGTSLHHACRGPVSWLPDRKPESLLSQSVIRQDLGGPPALVSSRLSLRDLTAPVRRRSYRPNTNSATSMRTAICKTSA